MSPAYWAVGAGAVIDPSTNLQVNTLGVGGATAAGPAPATVDGLFIGASGAIDITRTDPANHAFRTSVDGDPGGGSFSRFTITADGAHRWAKGDGTAFDVSIDRSPVGVLRIDAGLTTIDSPTQIVQELGLGHAPNTFKLSFVPDTAEEGGIDLGGDISIYRAAPSELTIDISSATGGAVTILGPTSLIAPQFGLMLNATPAGAASISLNPSVAGSGGGGARPLSLTGSYTITGDPNATPYLGINVGPAIKLDPANALSNVNDNRAINAVLTITPGTGASTGVSYGNVGGTTDKLTSYRGQIILAASPAGVPALGASTATHQGEVAVFYVRTGAIDTGWTLSGGWYGMKIEAPSGAGSITGGFAGLDIADLGTFDSGAGTATHKAISLRTVSPILITDTASTVAAPQTLTNDTTSSAALEIKSTTRALLLSRMSTTERDLMTAVDGMELYNTTNTRVERRENGAWPPDAYTTGYVPGGNVWPTLVSGSTVNSGKGNTTDGAIYKIVVEVRERQTFAGMGVALGVTNGGTGLMVAGLYTRAGVKIAQTSTSGTAFQANGNTWQKIAFTGSVTLQPGRYVLVVSKDGQGATPGLIRVWNTGETTAGAPTAAYWFLCDVEVPGGGYSNTLPTNLASVPSSCTTQTGPVCFLYSS